MEIHRENLNLEDMLATSNYGVRVLECNQIPSLIAQGLVAIWICREGTSRSPDGAYLASNNGHPSLYLLGGFEKISRLQENEKEILFGFVTLVPYLLITLEVFEQEFYRHEISSMRRMGSNVIIDPEPNVIVEKHFSNRN